MYFFMRGRYRDRIAGPNEPATQTAWQHNTMVFRSLDLMAGLLSKRSGLQGLLYCAVGTGDPSWDTNLPSEDPRTTRLLHEIYRKPLDPNTDVAYHPDTHTLDVHITFGLTEAVGVLREFGIFGGDATATANSGYLFNYKVHGPIDKTHPQTLDRTVQFVLGSPIAPATPVVASIAPSSGPTAGGTAITITGSGFTGTSAVAFGAVAAASFSVDSDTQISATSPAGSGTINVTVTTPAGASPPVAADQFSYIAPPPDPTVSTLNPASGPAAGGTSVTVTGTGFSGATGLSFGPAAATGFTVTSDTQITATSPAGTGTVDVTVTTPGGTSATSAADQFSYIAPPPAPAVSSIAPSSGPEAGGTSVTVSGSGFTGASAVTFAGTAAASFNVVSDTQIMATSPAGSGVMDVVVTTPGGTSAASAADQFSYVAPLPTPAVTGVSPSSGPAAGGTAVTIAGTGFTGATAVAFGGVAAASFTVGSDTQITAVSPAGTGMVDVTVTTPGGVSATSAADQFSYVTPPPVPTVSALSPASGPAAGGTSVTITGGSFSGTSAVAFGPTPASSFTVDSDAQITATSPAGSGTVDVTVTTSAGASVPSTADQFSYSAPPPVPTVSSIAPSSGPAAGGISVTVTGSGFTGATALAFGGTAAAGFTVDSDTQISAISPAGSGAVDVTVTTPTGASAASAADQFTYTVPAPSPTVSALNPASGPAAGGTTVTIAGTGFTGASAVVFGPTPASSFTVDSDAQITATSPAGSGTVDVTVTTPGGVSAPGTGDQFTYGFGQRPALKGVIPATGPAQGGTPVSIVGAGFTGATDVRFGSVPASSFQVADDSRIDAVSPPGNGIVDVSVTTPAGMSLRSGGDQFRYVSDKQALPIVRGLKPSTGSIKGATMVAIVGTGFIGATAVHFGTTPASRFQILDDTQIDALSPPADTPPLLGRPPGIVDVTVTTPAGTSLAGPPSQFKYIL